MTRQDAYEARKANIAKLQTKIAELNAQIKDNEILNQAYLDDCMREAELDAQAQSAWGIDK